MEVEKLEAGRELDAMVAERVMGWACPAGYNYWMTLHGGGTFDLHALKANWNPSTDIAAAWEVVEKMRADGWMFHVDDEGGSPWWVEFSTDGYLEGGQAVGASVPLVICQAALLATADKDATNKRQDDEQRSKPPLQPPCKS